MRLQIKQNTTLQPTRYSGGMGRGFSRVLFFAILLSSLNAFSAISLTLNQASGGIVLAPSGANYKSSFGEMNALAVGVPTQTGVTAVACPANCSSLGNGALYFTQVQIVATGLTSSPVQTGVVKAYVRTDFTGNAASAMNIYACPSTSVCTSPNNYSAVPITAAAEVSLATGFTSAVTTATVGVAIFLPDNNGSTAFTNTGSAVIEFDLFINGSGTSSASTRLNLNNPNEKVDNAIQLTLAQAPSGRAITTASDYTLDFGNVNALGIGPGAGLTTVAQAGGIIYLTPYQLLPVFTDQTSTTSSLKICVSTNFVHSSVLGLFDSSSGGAGTFSAISTTCPSTAFTTTAADRSTVTRYLGLFVSKVNGATAYSGTDTATLTFTMTVP